jgi:hypothetical protein
MSTDSIEAVADELEADRRYKEGFDDGYEGNARKSEHPTYLEGWADGLAEADDDEDWDEEMGDWDYWD